MSRSYLYQETPARRQPAKLQMQHAPRNEKALKHRNEQKFSHGTPTPRRHQRQINMLLQPFS
jgi:hypothetical protein